MNYVLPLASPSAVPVSGSGSLFPVRRIYCVGRNYAEHAREMGADPDREPPFFFCKPADAIVQNGGTLVYPPATQNLQYEIELVIAIGKQGANIPVEKALDYIFGYAVGLDMTRRDLQAEAKKSSRPWDTAKGFDQSAPLTAIHPVSETGHPQSGSIWLKVNGELRQQGDLAQLIWPLPDIISHLSGLFTLHPGDLIFTGTPAGVGAVKPGDHMVGSVAGIDELSIRVTDSVTQ